MAKKKISDTEAEVIKDAIIDALETNDEVAAEETATEEVTPTEDTPTEEVPAEEVPAEEAVVPEVLSPGHHSRDFKSVQ
jgi:hypothetical protein